MSCNDCLVRKGLVVRTGENDSCYDCNGRSPITADELVAEARKAKVQKHSLARIKWQDAICRKETVDAVKWGEMSYRTKKGKPAPTAELEAFKEGFAAGFQKAVVMLSEKLDFSPLM